MKYKFKENILFDYFFSCISIFWILVISSLVGCKKLVDIGPPVDSITNESVYNESGNAISVLTGLYVNLTTAFTGSSVNNISLRAGLSSDELTLFNGVTNESMVAYYKNKLFSNINSSVGSELWTRFYFIIFTCNAAIEGLTASVQLPSYVKEQLLGEAYFLRAFSYFYLVNLYGEAPLVLTIDPKIAASLPREKVDIIYKKIVSDLKQAQGLLNIRYLNGSLAPYPESSLERTRPNKWAAVALLARVYLYTKDYVNAELESSRIISETTLYDTVPLNKVFLKNSKESIWQLQPIRTGRSNEDAFLFILPINGPNASANPVYLSRSLMAAFENGDKRAMVGNWVDRRVVGASIYDYAFKYKVTTGDVKEYPVVLRLAEQYLIRAEARACLNKLDGLNGAQNDLNVIRERAGLGLVSVTTKDKMLEDVFKERRVELFLEWGHRWLDIKRNSKVNVIMNAAAMEKNTNWESFQQLYPLPFNDILRSPNIKQNAGYLQ